MNVKDYKNKDKQRDITCTVFDDFIELAIFDNANENRFYFTYEEFDKLSKQVFIAKDEIERY